MADNVARSFRSLSAQFVRYSTLSLSILPSVCVAIGAVTGWFEALLAAVTLPLAVFALGRFPPVRRVSTSNDDPRSVLHHALATILGSGGRMHLGATCLFVRADDLNSAIAQAGPSAAQDLIDRVKSRLRSALREQDAVIRLEDASFAIVVDSAAPMDIESLMQIATRVQSTLADPVQVGSGFARLRASVGLCQANGLNTPTPDAIIEAAETALVEARGAGIGSIRIYAPAMRARRNTRDMLVQDVAHALENGDIKPWFQPQLSTDTGRVTGFEALVRWHHPDRGPIPPSDFMPALDSAGLLERLGEVMVEQSLRALASWDAEGLDVPSVGVNLSSADLNNPALAERISWQIDRFDLTPDRLAIEVLESVVTSSPDDAVAKNIAALAALGCHVDLDDFGTGHASITTLRQLRIDRLKIDRSFVTGVDKDREQQNMVTTILAMCEHLGIATLAEGVETTGEHAMLAQLGCNHVQGFAIAHPMPFEETHAWLRAQVGTLVIRPTLRRKSL